VRHGYIFLLLKTEWKRTHTFPHAFLFSFQSRHFYDFSIHIYIYICNGVKHSAYFCSCDSTCYHTEIDCAPPTNPVSFRHHTFPPAAMPQLDLIRKAFLTSPKSHYTNVVYPFCRLDVPSTWVSYFGTLSGCSNTILGRTRLYQN
jgi:hypothetical protein